MPTIDPNKVVDDAAAVAKVVVADPKAFYKSKRFWAAVIASGASYLGYLPPQYAVVATLAANILMPMLDKALAK